MGKKVVCFGEVLWDDFGTVKTIGGAPLNVCYHLSKLDMDPIIVSQVGQDLLGISILDQIDKWGIDGRYCLSNGQYSTSTVKVDVKSGGDIKYTITEGVAWDYMVYHEQLAAEIATAEAFVYGTLAARSPATRNVLLRYVKESKWPVLDINLRQPYCRPEIILPLIKACKTIKLNQDELDFVCTLIKGQFNSEQDAVSLIFTAFDNIAEIILTKGAEGAAYYNRSEHIKINGIRVKVKDTVGSGDSFLAAFINGKLAGKTNQERLSDAILLSAFIATQNGGCPPYTLTEIEKFKKSVI